jgi:pyrroline-5-carboxylate reductase
VPIEGTIAFVGAGFMGEALIKGLLRAEAVAPSQIVASEPRPGQREALASTYGIRVVEDNVAAIQGAALVVLAVKPQILDKVLEQLKGALAEETVVISLAAGKDLGGIMERLGGHPRVVRAMPNVACSVAEGATGLAAGPNAGAEDLARAQQLFDAVGMSVDIDESLLDAVTGLSGSGPAYIFMIVEALADAGVKVGIARWNAQALASQTVLGAAKLVIDSQEHTGRLKDMVCSPGGTAIAAVHTLEKGGLRTTLMDAVEAATLRSQELGRGPK